MFNANVANGGITGHFYELYLLLRDLIIVIVLSDLPGSFAFFVKQVHALGSYNRNTARK